MYFSTTNKNDGNFLSFEQVSRQDQFERKNGGGFDAVEFEDHPERYVSNFAKKFAPYASVIVNGIYWSPETPRLLTIPDAKSLLTPESNSTQMWVPSSKGKKAQKQYETLFPDNGAPSHT